MHFCMIKTDSVLQMNCSRRDLLSQAIFAQMEKDGTDFVWEDMRPLGEEYHHETFSKYFSQMCRRRF